MPFFIKNNKEKISYLLVIFVLILFSVLILWNANWVFDMFWADDYQFVSRTAIGKPSHAWTGEGRFWPLGLCDYCLLLAVPYGKTVTAHFVYNCTTMIVSSLLFFGFLKRLPERYSCYLSTFCILILFSLSSFALIHMACIYPERQMFLMLSIFLFFYWKATKEGEKTSDYIIAFVAAIYATYLKEPVFGLWIIFALSNLIFGKISAKNRKFNRALLINSAIWICIYTYRSVFRDRTFIEGTKAYAGASINFSDVFVRFFGFFNEEPILYVLLMVVVIRFIEVFRNREKYNFISDSALLAGLGYVFAYWCLNTRANHYFFPGVLLGLPAFAKTLIDFNCKCLRYMFISAAILSSIYSANKSYAWIEQILEHRQTDPKMFSQWIEKTKKGKQILWVTEKGKEFITKENSREIDQMKFRRYQIFFDYYAGYWGKKHFPLFQIVSDYSRIDNNTVVICSNETLASSYGKEIISHIKAAGLNLTHSNNDLGTKIFE